MWPVHTLEYHSALERKEILTRATMWMNPEDVMLSHKKATSSGNLFNTVLLRTAWSILYAMVFSTVENFEKLKIKT